ERGQHPEVDRDPGPRHGHGQVDAPCGRCQRPLAPSWLDWLTRALMQRCAPTCSPRPATSAAPTWRPSWTTRHGGTTSGPRPVCASINWPTASPAGSAATNCLTGIRREPSARSDTLLLDENDILTEVDSHPRVRA